MSTTVSGKRDSYTHICENLDDTVQPDEEIVGPEFIRTEVNAFLSLTNSLLNPSAANDFALVDDGVVATVTYTDTEILNAVKENKSRENESDDEEDHGDETEVAPISLNDALKSTCILRKFLHQEKNVKMNVFQSMDIIAETIADTPPTPPPASYIIRHLSAKFDISSEEHRYNWLTNNTL